MSEQKTSLLADIRCFLRASLECTFWNLRLLRKNVRFYLGLAVGFSICFFLTEKIVSLAKIFGTPMQIFEPFIFSFADGDSVLFASLALLLPLSQIPTLTAPASYLIFRSGKKSWVTGQMLTVVLVSIFYSFFLLFTTALFTIGNCSFANRWSDTATVLSFAPYQFDVALNIVRRTVKYTTPGSCAAAIFILTSLYMTFLSLINLLLSLRFGKRAGMNAVVILSFICYILTPDRFMVWLNVPDEKFKSVANLAAAWISPLQHCTYTMHSFGYDRLPTFGQSYLIIGGISLLLLALCFFVTRWITFTFHKGENHE